MANEVIIITGARGTGKSTLAATYLPPAEIGKVYVHDSEHSMNQIRSELKASGLDFGKYVDLEQFFPDLPKDDDLLNRLEKGDLPWVDPKVQSPLIRYYQFVIEDLSKNLTKDKYKVYILDTGEKFEAGMAAWVEANKKKAGVTTLAYGKLWTEGVYPLYRQFFSALFARGIETAIVCFHLKTPWEGNRPVAGKVEPSGKKLLYFLSKLMIWLVHDSRNADGAPAGCVLKERLVSLKPNPNSRDGWSRRRMLPERIPHCTWADIGDYLETGCNLANPREGERMNESELEMISELMTDKQMELMILSAQEKLIELQQQSPVLFPQAQPEGQPQDKFSDEEIRELAKVKAKEEGIPLPMALKALRGG